MALETKTTSFQRLYPGLARFPWVASGEGTGSLKSRVGQAAPSWEALSQAESGRMAASTARVRVRLPSVGQRCTLSYSLAGVREEAHPTRGAEPPSPPPCCPPPQAQSGCPEISAPTRGHRALWF